MTILDHRVPNTAAQPPIRRVLAVRELPILLILAAIIIATGIAQPRFFSASSLRSILLWIPLLTVVAMGQMMVIITRGIDVSVGSMIGLSGMIVAMALRDYPGIGVAGGAVVGMGVGAALGTFNGLLVAALDIPPIVATLGTLGMYRGLVFIVSGGRQVYAYELPDSLQRLSISGPFAQQVVPWVVIVAVVAAVATYAFLGFARTGRNIYAVGGNPPAAALRGLPVRRVAFLAYLLTGTAAGLAGVLYCSRFPSVNPAEVGVGYELLVIAAVVIGGTSIFGGSGSVVGVFLGCLLLGTINVALSVLHIPDAWQKTIYGVIILIAVIVDDLVWRRLQHFGR